MKHWILVALMVFILLPAYTHAEEPPSDVIVPNPCPATGCSSIPQSPSAGGIPTPEQKFKPLAGIPGFTDQGDMTLAALIKALYRLAIVIGAMVAVVKIMIAGFKYMGSDSVGNKSSAKEDIRNALFGLLILLATVLIIETIRGEKGVNLDVFGGSAPKIHFTPEEPKSVITPPATEGTISLDKSKGCMQVKAGTCGVGNVGILKGRRVGCAPEDAVPAVPGQDKFKYMTEDQCTDISNANSLVGVNGRIDKLIESGKGIYGLYEVKRTDPQPTTDSLLEECKAAGGSQVVTAEVAYSVSWLKTVYGYICTD